MRTSLAFEKLGDGFEVVGQRTLCVALPLLKGAKLDQANWSGELGLVQSGLKAANGVGFADRDRHFKNVFSQASDSGNASAASTKKSAGPQIIESLSLDKVVLNELENLLQSQRHDPAQMFQVDGL